MGKCEDCGTEIGDNYIVCVPCLKKRKQENNGTNEVVHTLQQLNNNLYAIRSIQEEILFLQYGRKLIWDKEEKKFVIKK